MMTTFYQRCTPQQFWNPTGTGRSSWTLSSNRKCTRCGLTFSYGHLSVCPALLSQCFKCGKIGHFSRNCFSSEFRFKTSRRHNGLRTIDSRNQTGIQNGRDAGIQNNRDATYPQLSGMLHRHEKQRRNKCKSRAKKRRDKERISAFKERKSLQGMLPFSTISDNEISNICNWNGIADQKIIAKLRQQVSKLSEECEKLSKDGLQQKCSQQCKCIAFSEELAILRMENSRLREEISESNKQLDSALDIVRNSEEDKKTFSDLIQKQKYEIMDLKHKSHQLDDINLQNKIYIASNNTLKTQIYDLKRQLETLQSTQPPTSVCCNNWNSGRVRGHSRNNRPGRYYR